MNPVIFLRPVEYSLGSPDNVIIGLDLKYKVLNNQYFYSQIVFDEFTFKEIQKNDGYWANKYAFQIGYKIFQSKKGNLFTYNIEYNYVRPYMYSHWTSSSYGHYAQPLAHPLGANFDEIILSLNLTKKRLKILFNYNYSRVGLDDIKNDSISYGNDIFLDYNLRSSNYEVYMFNGIKSKVINLSTEFSYLIDIKNNLKFGLFFRSRKFDYKDTSRFDKFYGVFLKTDLFNYYYDR